MKKQLLIYSIGVFFLWMATSCGEDVDSLMKPDQATVVTGIKLQVAESNHAASLIVPEKSALGLEIVQTYNDGSDETMTTPEVIREITWEIQSDDDMAVITDEETGSIRLKGIGTGDLAARYNASSKTGNKQLLSNALTISTEEAILNEIEVVPAVNYAVGCDYAQRSNNEVVVGCLMQFRALAHYNNGLVLDITEKVDWKSENGIVGGGLGVADLVTEATLSHFQHYDWYEARSDFISKNNLLNKKGLVLGYIIGHFEVTATYTPDQTFIATSETVTVSRPELYALDARITVPGGSDCSDNCTLFENTTLRIDIKGIYNNGVVDPISRPDISISPLSDAIHLKQVDQKLTGEVDIAYQAPPAVAFTVTAEGITRQINATIAREEIINIKEGSPAEAFGETVSRKSNTDIYFLLDADYNNDIFDILDDKKRQVVLNTEIFHTWEISDERYLSFQDPAWVAEGYHTRTSEHESGNSVVTARSDLRTVTWNFSINNSSTKLKSLSINPSQPVGNGFEYTINAGEPAQFHVTAVFDNLTSEPLDNSKIDWTTYPQQCQLELVNSAEVACIDESGKVDTYEPLKIIATTRGFDPDISTDITLNVDQTALSDISIVSEGSSMYGKDSSRFVAVGTFDNSRTHVLPDQCVAWSENSGEASFVEGGLLIAKNVASLENLTVSVESVVGCGGALTLGRIIDQVLNADLPLAIKPLPEVSIKPSVNTVTEGDESVTIGFQISESIDRSVTIPFMVSGTGIPGTDHDLTSRNVTVAAGNTESVPIPIEIRRDNLDENQETIIVSLLEDGLINARLSDDDMEQKSTLIINDHADDQQPNLDLNANPALSASEGDTVRYTFTLSAVSGRDIRIDFVVGGDMTNQDYEIQDVTNDSLTIPAGDDSMVLDVRIINDGNKEATEQLTFDVSADYAFLSQTSIILEVLDIDYLQFIDLGAGLTCQTGKTCQQELESHVNANKNVIPYGIQVDVAPDWVRIDSNPWRLIIDAPETPQVGENVLICVTYESESSCNWIDVTITP